MADIVQAELKKKRPPRGGLSEIRQFCSGGRSSLLDRLLSPTHQHADAADAAGKQPNSAGDGCRCDGRIDRQTGEANEAGIAARIASNIEGEERTITTAR